MQTSGLQVRPPSRWPRRDRRHACNSVPRRRVWQMPPEFMQILSSSYRVASSGFHPHLIYPMIGGKEFSKHPPFFSMNSLTRYYLAPRRQHPDLHHTKTDVHNFCLLFCLLPAGPSEKTKVVARLEAMSHTFKPDQVHACAPTFTPGDGIWQRAKDPLRERHCKAVWLHIDMCVYRR